MLTPAPLLPRFIKARRAMSALAARESWPKSQLLQHQLDRLNTLWASAIKTVPYYQALAKAQSLPMRFEDIEHFSSVVPVLHKQAVRDRPDDFLSAQHGRGGWRKSSGSTGTPMRFFASDIAHQASLQGQYRLRQMWGVELFDPMVVLMGAGVPRGASLLKRMRTKLDDCLRCRLRLPVHGIDRDILRDYLRQIERFKPKAIYGYSRAIQLLAQEAKASGFHCDSLRVVFLTSEPAFPALRAEVEAGLGAPTAIEYGATECQLIAGEGPDHTLRVRDDLVLVETPARDDGRWDILVTVLTNTDFPLIRYRIEDVTDAPKVQPERGFSVMGAIAGRNDDWIIAADGRKIHPAEIDAVFEGGRHNVRRYRVHQQNTGNLDVSVEPQSPGEGLNLESIRSMLTQLVGNRDIAVQSVAAVPTTPTGKHRLVTSDCGKAD